MNRGLNKVMLIGRVEADPEVRQTPGGSAVASFGLATPRTWVTPQGEQQVETEWFSVVAWGSLAEFCRSSLAQGQQLYVEGRLQTRRWEDDQGRFHVRTEVVAHDLIPLGIGDEKAFGAI